MVYPVDIQILMNSQVEMTVSLASIPALHSVELGLRRPT